MPIQLPKYKKETFSVQFNIKCSYIFHVDMEKCKVKNLLHSTDDLWRQQRIPIRRTWLVFDLPWILPVKGDNRNTAAISHYYSTFGHVIQVSLRIRAIWAESSLSAWHFMKGAYFCYFLGTFPHTKSLLKWRGNSFHLDKILFWKGVKQRCFPTYQFPSNNEHVLQWNTNMH